MPYRPGSPAWQAGYEHARRQAFGIALTAGDPAVRVAQMKPEAPVPDVGLDEMLVRFAGMRPTEYVPPTTLHERVAAAPEDVSPQQRVYAEARKRVRAAVLAMWHAAGSKA